MAKWLSWDSIFLTWRAFVIPPLGLFETGSWNDKWGTFVIVGGRDVTNKVYVSANVWTFIFSVLVLERRWFWLFCNGQVWLILISSNEWRWGGLRLKVFYRVVDSFFLAQFLFGLFCLGLFNKMINTAFFLVAHDRRSMASPFIWYRFVLGLIVFSQWIKGFLLQEIVPFFRDWMVNVFLHMNLNAMELI